MEDYRDRVRKVVMEGLRSSRPIRETAIGKDDILNLQIALNAPSGIDPLSYLIRHT